MEAAFEDNGKEQVLDRHPKRIKSLQFGILSPQNIVSQSVVNVADRNLYDPGNRPQMDLWTSDSVLPPRRRIAPPAAKD
jgi:hypothetical protein